MSLERFLTRLFRQGLGKRRAFTLVELLVVIAIIALLMSILMPALGRARQQAKDALCKSNLHQWCTVMTMYTGDNDGYIPGYEQEPEHWWPVALLKYYGDINLCLCPAATKLWSDGGSPDSPYSAWGLWDEKLIPRLHDAMLPGYEGLYGSYGMNEWVGNVPGEGEETGSWYWRRTNVRRAKNVPMLLDCDFMGGFPEHTDEPPIFNGQYDIIADQMRRYCLDRHHMAINGLFLDCSVRRIQLKELWVLKWHRNFATNGPWTRAGGVQPNDWYPWMRGLPDF